MKHTDRLFAMSADKLNSAVRRKRFLDFVTAATSIVVAVSLAAIALGLAAAAVGLAYFVWRSIPQ